jgi:hypothetical protein
MKNKAFSTGAFLAIRLNDGSFAYGRLLEFPFAAFYDFRSKWVISDLNEIAAKPLLFTLAVHESALDTWEIIGKLPLEDSLKRPVVQFMQDILDHTRCRIVDSEGNERSAKPEECLGLERAAVWEAPHVERRLLDTFLDRPNRSVEGAKVRLSDIPKAIKPDVTGRPP